MDASIDVCVRHLWLFRLFRVSEYIVIIYVLLLYMYCYYICTVIIYVLIIYVLYTYLIHHIHTLCIYTTT